MDATWPALAQLLEELPPMPTFASELQNSADPRDVPPWLISTGIHGFMQETSEKGLLHSDLATIVSDTSTQYLALYPVVENWLKLKTDNVLKRSGQVRMKILSTDINTAGNSPLNTLGSFKTVQHYASICTMFLVFCLGVSNKVHPGLPPCPLAPMAKQLLDSFSHSISNKQSIDPLAIGDCLVFLFIQVLSPLYSDTSFHVLQFITLKMLKVDGSYHPHHLITRIISPIQYCVRMAFLYLNLDCSPPPPDLPVSIPSPYSSVILQDLLHNDLANMWTYTTESDKINTPFSAMRSWQHLMASVTMYEGLPETTFWADTDYKQLSIEGHTITLPQIEKTIQRTFERVGTLMGDLTKGAPLPRFDRSKYTDPPDCTDVGFNYLVASDSYHSQFGPDFLLTTWLKRGDPASYTLGGGRGWNHGKIRDWLDLSDELTKSLYFCFHCGCGQPARGTEEESIKIVNTPESPRSIFWRANTFMVRTTYHKTQAITGYGKNRAVFLPGWLSQHLHNYLAYIRPAQLRFMNILADGQPDGDHTRLLLSHLWVTTSTGLMKSKHQTLILKNTFLNQGCPPLGLRQWRHACVAICDEYLKGHPRLDPNDEGGEHEDENFLIDIQRNHTSRTANHTYGGTSGHSLDRTSERGFRAASEAWQKHWGVKWGYVMEQDVILSTVNRMSPGQKAMQALQLFTGCSDPMWKTAFQEAWVTAVFESRTDLVVVAKTGSGKSLAYHLPPLVELNKTTVVIQPLVALAQETMETLKLKNIRVCYWKPGCRMESNVQVVVVSVDQASDSGFVQALGSLNCIQRFIIDEAHQYLDDQTYRDYMPGVARLRRLKGQFVFTTGTLAPDKEKDLTTLFHLVMSTTFREPTMRPELCWEIRDLKLETRRDVPIMIKKDWQEMVVERESRGMVFIQLLAGVETTCKELAKLDVPCAYYHGKMDPDVQKAQAHKWKTTERCVMVAT
ncbi:hypothetical protein PCANC_13330, partial [Puccinia coronata f. sp. avenae]